MNTRVADSFHTLIAQPTTLCNLNCGYCYLPERRRLRLMSLDVAEALAASVSAQNSAHPVEVVWHAGEPLATPIGHMRSLLAAFEPLRRADRVTHGVQTNATLINDDWCELLATYKFRIGVSVDGPADLNKDRLDWRGRSTLERAMRGIEQLRRAGLPYTAICVVTPSTIEHTDELLTFFESVGCTSVGFNLEEQEAVSHNRQALASADAERFWLRLWQLREGGHRLPIRDLDRLCDWLDATRFDWTPKTQSVDPIPTVSHNGDVVVLSPELLGVHSGRYDDFIVGNVRNEPIARMLARIDSIRYVREFTEALHACAETCGFFEFCGGAQAGNRYFEHGTFRVTETTYCRNTRQALVRAAALHLTGGEEVNS